MKMEIFRTMIDRLDVRVFESRKSMGEAAATDCAAALRVHVSILGRCRAVFAAAPSQNEFLDNLTTMADIPWAAIEAFHMDEYLGLAPNDPRHLGRYLKDRLFNKVNFHAVYYIIPDSIAADRTSTEHPLQKNGLMERYAQLIGMGPIHIACLGVGENGHIAFNDPSVADFNDPFLIKEVELEESCRLQQVNDGNFVSLEEVPRRALTLTIPALTAAKRIFCVVPGSLKAKAVYALLTGPIHEACPASVLRRHPACTLYLDQESAAEWLSWLGKNA